MFKPQPFLYYIIHTFEGYIAKFEPDDGLYVQEKIAKQQKDTIIYQGKLADPSLATIVLQEVQCVNLGQPFYPQLLESRLREIY